MRQIRYRFHTEWCEDAGQFYAHRHDFDSVSDARNAHTSALGFMWATRKHRPSVSDLYAITSDVNADTGKAQVMHSDTIAPGIRREIDSQPAIA